MDLFQALIVPRDGDLQSSFRTAPSHDLRSSQTSIGAPSSPAPLAFSSQQQSLSSQGFSVTQDIPRGLDPLSVIERPPSCGQEDNLSISVQRPARFLMEPYDDGIHQMQNEICMPGLENVSRSYIRTSIPQDDAIDNFSDTSCPPSVQSMEDWEKANPYTGKKNTDTHTSLAGRPKLVPVTAPRSTGEWKTKLQHRCDQHGVRPEFDYQQPLEQAFVAILTIGGRRFETPTPQPSKKLAQEEVCKLAVAEMSPLEKMEGLEGAAKKGKKRKSGDADLEQPGALKADKSEDWISVLNTHCQQTRADPPSYEDSVIEGGHQSFASKLTISERFVEPFVADPDEGFRSKKDARSAVARAAVLWLRSEGILPDPARRPKRRTSSQGSITGTGLTGIMEFTPKKTSLPEQLHRLVQELGLKSPKWLLSKSVLPSGEPLADNLALYDMHAEFDERDTIMAPELRGRQGEVRHCLGQKKAKEECCRVIVPLLEGIKAKRLALV